jgi:hypothetical protein
MERDFCCDIANWPLRQVLLLFYFNSARCQVSGVSMVAVGKTVSEKKRTYEY